MAPIEMGAAAFSARVAHGAGNGGRQLRFAAGAGEDDANAELGGEAVRDLRKADGRPAFVAQARARMDADVVAVAQSSGQAAGAQFALVGIGDGKFQRGTAGRCAQAGGQFKQAQRLFTAVREGDEDLAIRALVVAIAGQGAGAKGARDQVAVFAAAVHLQGDVETARAHAGVEVGQFVLAYLLLRKRGVAGKGDEFVDVAGKPADKLLGPRQPDQGDAGARHGLAQCAQGGHGA
jgi:hypothetical protein